MKLYHYSNQEFPCLKTRRAQGAASRDELAMKPAGDRPGVYIDHISFFIERIPLDIMSEIFPTDHSVWRKNNSVFEYTIESSGIHGLAYELVESPEKAALFYDDSISVAKYHSMLRKVNEENKYIGHSNKELEECCRKFLGKTRSFFEQIKSRPNYGEIKYKYAATVPHLMLYPKDGVIYYQTKGKIVIP